MLYKSCWGGVLRPVKSTKFSRFTMWLKNDLNWSSSLLLSSLGKPGTYTYNERTVFRPGWVLQICPKFKVSISQTALLSCSGSHERCMLWIVLCWVSDWSWEVPWSVLTLVEGSTLLFQKLEPFVFGINFCGYPCSVHIIISHMYSTNVHVTLNCIWNVLTSVVLV